MRFRDRVEAGRLLAHTLEPWKGRDCVVLGIPRGGVPVAKEVATLLNAPFDLVVVRKLGVPFQPELAMGAIGEGGVLVLNEEVIASAHVGREEFVAVERRERAELDLSVRRLRSRRNPEPLDGKLAIIVDDGFATGATAIAAAAAARARGAANVILAAPVGTLATIDRLRPVADEVMIVTLPNEFVAVGAFYDHFEQITDEEVRRLLERSSMSFDRDVHVDLAEVDLPGRLTVPHDARGTVVFAHGSGSSRHSPRNRYVAERLAREGFATLLIDLLLPSEEQLHSHVFDIDLLTTRLSGTVAWARAQPALQGLPVFLLGASTGSAAALATSARHGSDIAGVISRGGRPDLVADLLGRVPCPVLLIVGGADSAVVDSNRAAMERLGPKAQLVIIAGAGHLFEEPGALDEVTSLARDWLLDRVEEPRAATTLQV